MSLEQNLQQRWAEDSGLSALIAPDRVFTARTAEIAPPRAVIVVVAARPILLASGPARWEEATLRITIEDDDYGRLTAVGERLAVVFHRVAWAADHAPAVARLVCRRRGPIVARSKSLWRQVSDWSALLRRDD